MASLTITVNQLHGVEIIAVTAEKPASGSYHSASHAEHCLAAHFVLRAGDRDHGDDGSVEQTSSSSTLSGSPFVTAFAAAHIPFAAAIMNFVVLTAALSSVNTNLYFQLACFFSLGRGGYALNGWDGEP